MTTILNSLQISFPLRLLFIGKYLGNANHINGFCSTGVNDENECGLQSFYEAY